MNSNRSVGLLSGLLVVLVTVGLAASGGSQTPIAAPTAPPPSATPTMAVAALPATATPTSIATPTAAHTPAPTLPPASTPLPSPSASPSPTPEVNTNEIIGTSVQGRPIVAQRIGEGPFKVALIGDIHGEFEANTHLLGKQLLSHFVAHPEEVPPGVSLWIIPSMNPDGLATGHRWNANDVDLNRNADTDLDGCAGNDWAPDTVGLEGPHPGAGGPYPFSEPETRAVRDFLADAWVAVFYHSAAEAIFVDTCQRHAPTARLAEILSESSGYPVPEEGWAGYPITGDFGDYLVGEGVAAVTVELTDKEAPEFERNLAGVRALLAAVDQILSEEATQVGAEYVWLDPDRVGQWRYEQNRFIHPIALAVLDDVAYLLDGGRVLALDLDQPRAPRQILAPGDLIRPGSPQGMEGVRVLEPLDLAAAPDSVLVLDRAGDVYRYDPATRTWAVERYDRPSGETYDHYYVTLDADGPSRYLLDTTHEQVWRFPEGEYGAPWVKLPQSRDVDLGTSDGNVFVLTRNMNGPQGHLLRHRGGQRVGAFQPNVDLMHPRQVVATEAAVYVLDRGGRRLLALDPESGSLLTLYQFTDRRAVSAIWADPAGERLLLAGRDTLYFYDEPDRQASIEGGSALEDPQPHDATLLEQLRGLQVPIEGAKVTNREFQMPGAPRHYRLGVHEGIDFYGHTVGVPVGRGTPVRAVADGVVIRALVDYEPLTAGKADAWYAQSHSLGYTPPEVLDGYRGRQVWIDHGQGLVSRYAHLDSIAPEIVEGATVSQGQVIATVGNSGTPGSVNSRTYDAHLHLELWLGSPSTEASEAVGESWGQSHYIGQFLRPIEAREWIERILR